jgi:unsaturated rhamnogalacturonyl hydrolase
LETHQLAWSVRMADSMMARRPKLAERWGYEYGLMLKGIAEVWRRTRDPKYFDYIKRNVDQFVNADGAIQTYKVEEYNIDQVNAGKILFFLYEETRDERYRKAVQLIREQFTTHPRTREGGLWHKKIYPHQMWLDGLYMGAPFLAQYARDFNEAAAFDDVARQVILMDKYMRDEKTGLLYHGWDESREQSWADPETGRSPHFWGRGMGWYVMAIVDLLDFLPQDHPQYDEIVRIFRDAITALAKVQDSASGLWYQVLDQGARAENYLEASGSAMIVYAMVKGVRCGHLEPQYLTFAQKGYQGMLDQFIEVDAEGLASLNRICQVGGLGKPTPHSPYRDGTFEYYISEPIVANDYKGVGPFILAALELKD